MDSRVIVALDYANEKQAQTLVDQLDPSLCRLKVGKELFTAAGPAFVESLVQRGYSVFLDLKFHDIPNTVAKACAAAARMGVWMLNVHASGGSKMMQAGRVALQNFAQPPLLIGVTVLTSMDADDLAEIGILANPLDQVKRLARLTQDSGLDGVVCSPQEVSELSQLLDNGFLFVTPGVRPAGANSDDQKRVMTPSEAMNAGASYLVIGRPITQADDPLQALRDINQKIRSH